MSMIFKSSAFPEARFLSVALRICVCKSNNLFFIDQMFFKEILKFFDDLNFLFFICQFHSCSPFYRTAKIRIFLKLTTFISEN